MQVDFYIAFLCMWGGVWRRLVGTEACGEQLPTTIISVIRGYDNFLLFHIPAEITGEESKWQTSDSSSDRCCCQFLTHNGLDSLFLGNKHLTFNFILIHLLSIFTENPLYIRYYTSIKYERYT